MNHYTCRLGNLELSLREHGDYGVAPRLYVDIKDESIFEHVVNRKRRPYNIYKTAIWGSELPQVLNLGKLSWSQYAGCSCPCSPGFILPKQVISIGGREWRWFDAWVTFKDLSHVDERKAPRLVLI